MRNYLIIMMLLLATGQGIAQSHDRYSAELKEAILKMKDLDKMSKGGFFLMDIRLKMTPKARFQGLDNQVEAKDVRLKMILGEEFLLYETEFFSIYQDGKEVYQVFHPEKLILKKPMPLGAFQHYATTLKTMDRSNDELFDEGRLHHITYEQLEGRTVKKMVFNISRKGIEEFGTRSITYWYEPKAKQIMKQLSVFAEDHPMQQQEVTYYRVEPNYKGKVPRTAKYAVLDKHAGLLPQYQGYRLEITE